MTTEKKYKAYRVTISGSYRTSNREMYDYSDVTGVIPFCDEDLILGVVKNRYARMWLSEKKKEYPHRVHRIREVYVDQVEETEASFSLVGKDIRKLSFEELQDLATAKDLREIPLWKTGSLSNAVRRAYSVYVRRVNDMSVEQVRSLENQMFNDLPAIIIKDLQPRRTLERKITNTQILDVIAGSNTNGALPTFEELKVIAAQSGIDFHHKTGYDKLYEMVYGQ